MKAFLAGLALLLVLTNAAHAKLEFQISECALHSVAITEGKIVLSVSGTCRFLLVKKSDSMGNAVEVQSLVDHGTIVIKRGMQKQEEWEQLGKKAQSLSGKTIWIDCFGVVGQFEQGEITYVSCLDASFGELKKASR